MQKISNQFEFKSVDILKDIYNAERFIIPDHIFRFYADWSLYLGLNLGPLVTTFECGFNIPINLVIKTSLFNTDSIVYGDAVKPNIVRLFLTDIISCSCELIDYDNNTGVYHLLVNHKALMSNIVYFICHEISHICSTTKINKENLKAIEEEEANVNSIAIEFLKRNSYYVESLIQGSIAYNTPYYDDPCFDLSRLDTIGNRRIGSLIDKEIEKYGNTRDSKIGGNFSLNNVYNTAENWYLKYFINGIEIPSLVNVIVNYENVTITFTKISKSFEKLYYGSVQIKKDGIYLAESIPYILRITNELFWHYYPYIGYYMDYDKLVDLKNDRKSIEIVIDLIQQKTVPIDYEREEDDQ